MIHCKGKLTCAVAAMAVIMAAGCDDDFGRQDTPEGALRFDIDVPAGWSSGMQADRTDADTHCTSIDPAKSDMKAPLYIHTIETPRPALPARPSRGTQIAGLDGFYSNFSLSAICYTGDYNEDWTPNFAYDLNYSKTGLPADESGRLYWPIGGKVRFFAFAPRTQDFSGTDGTLSLSSATAEGTPMLSYTVPGDVSKQIDLMRACTDATNGNIALEFKHALTAIKIEVGDDMLAGTINKVTLSGVHGSGTLNLSTGQWTPTGQADASYSIEKDIKIATDSDPDSGDKLHAKPGTAVTGTKDDGLVFMLIPQTLGDGASLTVEFTEDFSGTKRSITGSLKGKDWTPGMVLTYKLSPKSIDVVPRIEEFSKKAAPTTPSSRAETEKYDTIPYTGVWYDVSFKSYLEVTQADEPTKQVYAPVKMQYQVDDDAKWYNIVWTESTTDPTAETGEWNTLHNGAFVMTAAAADGFKELQEKLTSIDKTANDRTADKPFNLYDVKSESANCYMIDQPGYYSLPLVYGNALKGGAPNAHAYTHFYDVRPETPVAGATYREAGLNYYVDSNNEEITQPYIDPSKIEKAVLIWQDSPDLVNDIKLSADKKNLEFRVRPYSIGQGNAVVGVVDNDGNFLWSWHIWVTYQAKEWEASNLTNTVLPETGSVNRTYTFVPSNLGYCDPHTDTDKQKKVKIRFSFPKVCGTHLEKPLSITKEFVCHGMKGSRAGDNTYYQWGRKDPMLPGIYNETTKTIPYNKDGKTDNEEFTMENKQFFVDDPKYAFGRSNLGDEECGVTIGYTIKYPYRFIMSRWWARDNKNVCPKHDKNSNHRDHWHIFDPIAYLGGNKFYSMWNSKATTEGVPKGDTSNNVLNIKNLPEEYKTIYDPCPAGYHVPSMGAFANAQISVEKSLTEYKWELTFGSGVSLNFPATGMRNKSLTDLQLKANSTLSSEILFGTVPAFKDVMFVTTATNGNSVHQVLVLYIEGRKGNNSLSLCTSSANSYGMPVRPVKD